MKYGVTTPEKLNELCIKNEWFTGCTVSQYQKLHLANEHCWPIEEIAALIWMLPTGWIRENILKELKKERDKYLAEDCDEEEGFEKALNFGGVLENDPLDPLADAWREDK